MTALTVKDVSDERRVSFSIFNPAFQQSDDHCDSADADDDDNVDHVNNADLGNYVDKNTGHEDNYE